jgi:hypothetical protein
VFTVLALLLAASPSVREGGAALRESCSADAATVARLEAGAPVRVLFALSGDMGACLKVNAGGQVGYVMRAEVEGLDAYDRGRALASDRELPQMIRAEVTRLKADLSSEPRAANPLELLASNQPRAALRVIESTLLKQMPNDPNVLALAGMAAFQSDQPARAAAYWKASLAIRPDPLVERLLVRAQRELASDRSQTRTTSARFVLRYDGAGLPEFTASQILRGLDEEYARLDQALGCGIDEQVVAVVQTREAFLATTGAELWSGGQFDGRIRVVLDGTTVTPEARRAFAHELVHACLARHGRFPHWFHEGMAQRWSGERPARALLDAVSKVHQMGEPGEDPTQAALFYAWSYLEVQRLYERRGDDGVRRLVHEGGAVPLPAPGL